MDPSIQYTAYLFLAPLSAFVCIFVAAYAYLRHPSPLSAALVWLNIPIIGWLMANTLELADPTQAGTLFWSRVTYTFLAFTPVAWLSFALHLAEIEHWRRLPRFLLFCVFPALTIVIVWTNDLHHWLWRAYHFTPVQGMLAINVDRGPYFWLLVAYSYGLYFAGAVLIIRYFLRSSRLFIQQSRWVVVGALVPILFSIVYNFRLLPWLRKDYTPISFALGSLAFAVAINRYHLFNLRPVARSALVDSLPHPMLVLDLNCRLVDMNPAAESLLSLSHSAIGQTDQQVLPEWLAQAWRCREERETPQEYEIERDGQQHYYEMKTSLLKDQRGRSSGWLVVLNDVTAHKQAQKNLQRHADELEISNLERQKAAEALTESKAMFEKLVHVARASSGSLALIPRMQNILKVSVEITAAERGSLFLLDNSGQVTHAILARGDIVAGHTGLLTRIMESGLAGWVYRQEQPVLAPDIRQDDRWVTLPNEPYIIRSAIIVPIFLNSRIFGILSVFHPQVDWFSQKQLELLVAAAGQMAHALNNAQIYEEQLRLAGELARAKDAADAANLAKSVFLAKMSHELRTPLTAIIGFSEMLQENALEQGLETFVDKLGKIQYSAYHLLDLINDILDFSRIEAGKLELMPEIFDLNDLVYGVVESVRPLADKNQNVITLECPRGFGVIYADPMRIRQILYNLVSNACKFTTGGAVTIESETGEDELGERWLNFRVKDTGIGISAAQLQHLFQPFSQVDSSTSRKYGGSGLGLVICRQLAQMMGGDISVVSELGKGSIFTVRLPAPLPENLPESL